MKIEKVTFQTTYNIGPFLNTKVGFEATVDQQTIGVNGGSIRGEEPGEVLSKLRILADEWHKKEYPHLYQNKDLDQLLTEHIMGDPYLHPPKQPAVIDYGKHDGSPQGVLADIQKAKTMEELTPYKLLAAQDKSTYSAYCERLKELAK